MFIAHSLFVEGDGWIVNGDVIAVSEKKDNLIRHCQKKGFLHFYTPVQCLATKSDIVNGEVSKAISISEAEMV